MRIKILKDITIFKTAFKKGDIVTRAELCSKQPTKEEKEVHELLFDTLVNSEWSTFWVAEWESKIDDYFEKEEIGDRYTFVCRACKNHCSGACSYCIHYKDNIKKEYSQEKIKAIYTLYKAEVSNL